MSSIFFLRDNALGERALAVMWPRRKLARFLCGSGGRFKLRRARQTGVKGLTVAGHKKV